MDHLLACLSVEGILARDMPAADAAGQPLRGPAVATADGVHCAIRGRPRLGDAAGCNEAVAGHLLEQFRSRGAAIIDDIEGGFAVVFVDTNARRIIAAIDRFGEQSLCYAREGASTVVATSAAEVADRLDTRPGLNPQALHDFMLSHMVSAPDTVFEGVRKLPAGHRLIADDKGTRTERYWRPDFAAQRKAPPRPDDVLDALQAAIESEGPGDTSGCFLSGGLDSSTVAGLLSRSQGAPVKAFSVGFGVEEFDELHYARVAARHFGCEHIEYNVTPDDIVDLVPRIVAAYDEPFGNSSAIPTFCCARLAKAHGVDHLYAGDGGDELFGGNERYARQPVFERYQRIPALLRRALLEPVARRLDPDEGWWPLQKFASYVRQARDPLPDRFESWNLIYREGARQVFHADFLARIDVEYPLQKMREVWASCPSDDLLDRMLWYDWKFTLADSDLPKVSTMCELAGVRVSYPMLESRFVELSMGVPSSEKIRGHELRSFFRDAVRPFLPAETLDKHKHGFGLPFGVWLKTHERLQAFVYGSLDGLRERGIFDPAFLQRVADEHRVGHAGYYGYAIWDLVMLEQWMRTHVDVLADA